MDIGGAINGALSWIWSAIKAVFDALWEMLTDVISWVFDMLLAVVVSAVTAIDVTAITGQLGWFEQIPGDVMTVMAACGFGSAFTIISAALLVRFVLQLIPFVRLGS